MICQNCGNTIDDASVFCGHCGTAVASAQGAQSEQLTQSAQMPYPQPVAPQYQQSGSDPGTAPLVLGILAIVSACVLAFMVPFVGPIAGIVLGALGISKGGKVLKADPSNGRAKGGKITGIIGLVFSIFALLATIAITVLFGVAIYEIANNPDVAIEILEEAASQDETGQLQELADELKGDSTLG